MSRWRGPRPGRRRPGAVPARHGAVVEETDGFVVVGSATTGEESLAGPRELRPDLVLMDVNLPGIDGIEAARRLTAAAGRPGRGAALDVRRGRVRPRRLRRRGVRRQGGLRSGPAVRGLGLPLPSDAYADSSAPTGMRSASTSSAPRANPPRPRPGRRWPAGRRRPACRRDPQDQVLRRRPTARSRTGRARPRHLGAAEVDRGLHAGGEPPPGGRRVDVQGRRRGRCAPGRPQRRLEAGPGQLGREHATGQLAQRLQRGVGAGDQPVEPVVGAPRGDRGAGPAELVGQRTRWGSTSREIAASRVRRAASSASMIRDREPASSSGGPVELGHVRGELGLERGVAEGDRGLVGERLQQPRRPGAAGGPSGGHLDAAQVRPPFRTGTTCVSPASAPSWPQSADAAAAPGTSRVAVAPRADTARPAASATAGSRVSGDGVSASRRLKSASAS